MANPTFKITMENGGVIEGELYPEKAPQSVANFVDLAEHNYYDGLIFHRVISGFMIQGGGFIYDNGLKEKKAPRTIKGEFAMNGVKNDLHHAPGVISMARTMVPDSASSQFFICHADAKFLDGQYASFGKVVSGMEVVDAIAGVKTNFQDRPLEEQKIASITVDTKGETYPEPKKLQDPYGRF